MQVTKVVGEPIRRPASGAKRSSLLEWFCQRKRRSRVHLRLKVEQSCRLVRSASFPIVGEGICLSQRVPVGEEKNTVATFQSLAGCHQVFNTSRAAGNGDHSEAVKAKSRAMKALRPGGFISEQFSKEGCTPSCSPFIAKSKGSPACCDQVPRGRAKRTRPLGVYWNAILSGVNFIGKPAAKPGCSCCCTC